MKKIKISFGKIEVFANLENTETSNSFYQKLPYITNVNTWGDEIYCEAPMNCDLENGAKAEVEIGDLAYWPNMPAFCVFFGPTPISSGKKPVAAGPVNVMGKLERTDPDILRQVKNGDKIIIEAV